MTRAEAPSMPTRSVYTVVAGPLRLARTPPTTVAADRGVPVKAVLYHNRRFPSRLNRT